MISFFFLYWNLLLVFFILRILYEIGWMSEFGKGDGECLEG